MSLYIYIVACIITCHYYKLYGIYFIFLILYIVATDYVPFSETLTIPAGQTSVSYTATIRNDVFPEPTESFQVQLGLVSGNGVVLSPTQNTSTVSILDTDSKL